MTKCWLIAVALLTVLPGCVLQRAESDPDTALFATAWETPGLAQQPVAFKFTAEGDCADVGTARQEALDALLDSGKFRLATADEKPACSIEVTLAVRRKTHTLRTVCGALALYAWPIDTRDHICEAFGVIRSPSGEVVERCYAQSRGAVTVWVGNLFRSKRLANIETAEAIRRDTVKAVTVKMCRALAPKAERRGGQ